MSRPPETGEGIDLRSLERTILAVGAVFTLASLYWWSAPVTAGVGIGAAVVWLNFRWLRRIVTGALSQVAAAGEGGAAEGARGAAGLRLAVEFVVKFAALVAAIYLLVRRVGVDAVGLLVGLSAVVVAVVVEFLRSGPRGGVSPPPAAEPGER